MITININIKEIFITISIHDVKLFRVLDVNRLMCIYEVVFLEGC